MVYDILARRLRPQRFQDLVGHAMLALSIQSALLEDRLAACFVFAGLRGTGKTSLARILAKAINCPNLKQKIEHIRGLPGFKAPASPELTALRRGWLKEIEPCNTCRTCLEITKGNCPDVLEIDAASNRGIENIRELREQVYIANNYCPFKVYIIDEAHMLTNESFNALLKILEEPPAHVKFMLASTEIKKFPPTILSRCLCYEFTSIPPSAIEGKLKEIAEQERRNLPPEWIPLIVHKSGGSMRDALSAMELVLNVSLGEHSSAVASFLGFSDLNAIFQLYEPILQADAARALQELEQLLFQGVAPKNLLKDLLEVAKLFLVAQKIPATDGYWQSFYSHYLGPIYSLAEKLSPNKSQLLFDLIYDQELKAFKGDLDKNLLEVLVLRLCCLEEMIGVKELIRALRSPSPTPNAARAESPRITASPVAKYPPNPFKKNPAPPNQPTQPAATLAQTAQVENIARVPQASVNIAPTGEPKIAPSTEDPAHQPEKQPVLHRQPMANADLANILTLNSDAWHTFMENLPSLTQNAQLLAYLTSSKFVDQKGSKVRIGFPNHILQSFAKYPKHHTDLDELFFKHFGFKAQLEKVESSLSEHHTYLESLEKSEQANLAESLDNAKKNPAVQTLLEVFPSGELRLEPLKKPKNHT